jgi:hypothetical protein
LVEERLTKLADYKLLASGKLGPIDPDDPAMIDPRKGFWEHDMDIRLKMKRPNSMPPLELPHAVGFAQLEGPTVERAELVRFGERDRMGTHSDVAYMTACTPPPGHIHVHTDGFGMEIDVDGTTKNMFGAGVNACSTSRENSQLSCSYVHLEKRQVDCSQW